MSKSDNFVGSWKIFNVTPNEEGESRKVKVKVRVNPNGIFSVCSANIYNTIPVVANDETMEAVSELYDSLDSIVIIRVG